MRVPGQSYTRTLHIVEAQGLVQTGPYARIRHPGYLGSLLLWSGAATASGSVLAPILVLGVLLIAYCIRIGAEDRMLETRFGALFGAYRQRSWRLLPFLY